MIEVLRDVDGNITAVCEWLVFGDNGVLDDLGKIVHIAELEINKEWRGKRVLNVFIDKINVKCPQAQKVFFWRKVKYPDKPFKVYEKTFKNGRTSWVGFPLHQQ